jgi:hypothetical protein
MLLDPLKPLVHPAFFSLRPWQPHLYASLFRNLPTAGSFFSIFVSSELYELVCLCAPPSSLHAFLSVDLACIDCICLSLDQIPRSTIFGKDKRSYSNINYGKPLGRQPNCDSRPLLPNHHFQLITSGPRRLRLERWRWKVGFLNGLWTTTILRTMWY